MNQYNLKTRTELHTDASKVGIGGVRDSHYLRVATTAFTVTVLSSNVQISFRGYNKVVVQYGLEALAIVCSVKRFPVYLIGI